MLLRQAQELTDDARGEGLGKFRHELACAPRGEAIDEVGPDLFKTRLQRLGDLWAKSRVDEAPQAAVVVAYSVQEHAQPPVGEGARCPVVRRPFVAALAQACIAQEHTDLAVAEHGESVGCLSVPA